jgi:cellulose synthase (UDP-forming)
MIPQVLFFVFLLLTSVVGVWRDLGAGSLSLALAWNATNTVVLGAFVVTALREARAVRRANSARRRAAATARRRAAATARRRAQHTTTRPTAPARRGAQHATTRPTAPGELTAVRAARSAADSEHFDLITTGGIR